MVDAGFVAVVTGVFLIAGLVKGVVGLGLPVISLALLTATIGLTEAMSLLIIPSLVTNIWQAFRGRYFREIIELIWPFLVAATAAVGIGALALTRIDLVWLSALLGVVLMFYATVSMRGLRLVVQTHQARWLGPVMGLVNGTLTGMTGSFAVPGVMYFEAIGLDRDRLIQAMGILFTVSTIALAIGLQTSALLSLELGFASTLSVVPAVIGLFAGQQIREHLNEVVFRGVFYIALMALGGYIFVSALVRALLL